MKQFLDLLTEDEIDSQVQAAAAALEAELGATLRA